MGLDSGTLGHLKDCQQAGGRGEGGGDGGRYRRETLTDWSTVKGFGQVGDFPVLAWPQKHELV